MGAQQDGQRTKAPSPYQPEVAADAILFAGTHRRRDVFVGSSTPPTILAARLAPGVLDRVLATRGYDAQLDAAAAPASDGNLFEPAPGATQAARGRFDAEARTSRDIYTSRQADAVAAGVLASGAIGVQAALGAALVLQARAAARPSPPAVLAKGLLGLACRFRDTPVRSVARRRSSRLKVGGPMPPFATARPFPFAARR